VRFQPAQMGAFWTGLDTTASGLAAACRRKR
jgi:hypothetical protein